MSGGSRYGMAALSSEVAKVEQTAHGFRHMSLFAASCRMGELVAGRELDEGTAESFLIDVGRSLDLLELDVRRQVGRGLAKGKTTPRTAPKAGTMLTDRTDTLAAVVGWWQSVQAQEWKGRSAGTTLRILAGFALLASKAGKVRLEDSYREVAEASGVSVGTVYKHKARWLPFVRQVKVGNRITGTRTTWQLVARANGNKPASPAGMASGLFPNARTLSDPAHNAWHRWSNGWRVYCLLTDESTTSTHLAEITGLHPGTIRRICGRLTSMGVAERTENGWLATDDVAAADLMDDGPDHAERRRDRHAKERELHEQWKKGRIAALERVRSRAHPRDQVSQITSGAANAPPELRAAA